MKVQLGEKEYEIKDKIAIYIAIAFVCVVAYLFVWGNRNNTNSSETGSMNVATFAPVKLPAGDDGKENVEATESEIIRVYVKGCVENPGVYNLPNGSLIIDAVAAAGGFGKGANKNFNMVWKIEDNCMITIPSRNNKKNTKICSYELENSRRKGYKKQSGGNGSTKKSKGRNNEDLININKASKSELTTLVGVGEVIAQRIVEYRKQMKFLQVDDLKNVTGIGEKTFENMKDFICVK